MPPIRISAANTIRILFIERQSVSRSGGGAVTELIPLPGSVLSFNRMLQTDTSNNIEGAIKKSLPISIFGSPGNATKQTSPIKTTKANITGGNFIRFFVFSLKRTKSSVTGQTKHATPRKLNAAITTMVSNGKMTIHMGDVAPSASVSRPIMFKHPKNA